MSKRPKALLVDDDEQLREQLEPELDALGYTLDYANTGPTGLEMALTDTYSLILLDINLPGLEGTEVCKKVREKLNTPIIMLSQKADELSKVLLLEIGADDYITKPYAVTELKARVKALMRRINTLSTPNKEGVSSLKFKNLVIDFSRRSITVSGTEAELTSTEYDIVALLASTPGRPYSRTELLEFLYGFDAANYNRSITNHINRIRSKLESDPNNPEYILTVRGHGYRFADIEKD